MNDIGKYKNHKFFFLNVNTVGGGSLPHPLAEIYSTPPSDWAEMNISSTPDFQRNIIPV